MLDVRPCAASEEHVRLRTLHGYNILGTATERDFDDIAGLAAQLCDAPIALITLVDTDRQWFKARHGLDVCETPREDSFCAHAMHGDTVIQVPDSHLDPRFAGNPLVLGEPHIRFYAGAPLVTAAGHRLGSLCVIDRVPRRLTTAQSQGLQVLARHVITALELRRHVQQLHQANERLHDTDRFKDEFLSRTTHELRTPLTSINGYLEVLDDHSLEPAATARFMTAIRRNSHRLLNLVDDMLLAARLHADTISLNPHPVDLAALVHASVTTHRSLAQAKGLSITAQAPDTVSAIADIRQLCQALDRLVLNAIKFTTTGDITVSAGTRHGHPLLQVSDTGTGVSTHEQSRLFTAFRRADAAERREVQGAGLGLAIVKNIIDRHRGTVTMTSTEHVGTTVTITLPPPADAPHS